jgi:6-phosphofructokinase 2
MQITTVTMNPTIDKSSRVKRVVPERKLRCRPPTFEPGGGGINVSRAIRNLGGASLTVFPAGDGHTGRFFKELIEGEQLTSRAIAVKARTRESLMIYEESTGQQYRFGMPGEELAEADWQACLDAAFDLEAPPAYLVASGSLPPGAPGDFYARLADRCREKGIRLAVDTSGEPLCRAAEAGVFLLKPNLNELKTLAGCELDEEDDQEKIVRSLVAEGRSRYVVLSLGAAGVLAASQQGLERLRAPTVKIQSKVGAGDSTLAGITLKLSQGAEFREAVRYGVAAGAAAVMTTGSELCRREDVERLVRRIA